jgi:hypothetical protein
MLLPFVVVVKQIIMFMLQSDVRLKIGQRLFPYTKSLQDGPLCLDGKDLLPTTREPRRMYSRARHILKLTNPSGTLRNDLLSLNGVLLEFGGGTLLSDAIRSDHILYVDDEPPEFNW